MLILTTYGKICIQCSSIFTKTQKTNENKKSESLKFLCITHKSTNIYFKVVLFLDQRFPISIKPQTSRYN